MSYRRRQGRRAQRRQKVTRVEMARFTTKAFNLYERNRIRKTARRVGLLALLCVVAGVVGWLVAG